MIYFKSVLGLLLASSTAALIGCGGGDSSFTSPIAGSKALTSDASDDFSSEVIFVYNDHVDRKVDESINTLLSISIQKLDLAEVPFILKACGIYSTIPDPGGSTDFPPSAMAFMVRPQDVQKVLAVKGEVRQANGLLITNEEKCSLRERSLSASSRVMWFASGKYPDLFPGRPDMTQVYDGYEYTYFSDTRTYIGLKGGRVYLYNGSDWNFTDVGAATDYIPGLSVKQFGQATQSLRPSVQ